MRYPHIVHESTVLTYVLNAVPVYTALGLGIREGARDKKKEKRKRLQLAGVGAPLCCALCVSKREFWQLADGDRADRCVCPTRGSSAKGEGRLPNTARAKLLELGVERSGSGERIPVHYCCWVGELTPKDKKIHTHITARRPFRGGRHCNVEETQQR